MGQIAPFVYAFHRTYGGLRQSCCGWGRHLLFGTFCQSPGPGQSQHLRGAAAAESIPWLGLRARRADRHPRRFRCPGQPMLTIPLTDVRLLPLIRRDRRVDGRRGRYCIPFSMSIPPSLLS